MYGKNSIDFGKVLFMKYAFFAIIVCFAQMLSAQIPTGRTVSINPNLVKGPLNKSFNFCVGAGRANEGLRAD